MSELSTSTVRYLPIPGHICYRAGDDGSIWSQASQRMNVPRTNGTWTKLRPHRQKAYGHMIIYLGRCRCYNVHKLILETFVGLAPEGMECRHLNGDAGDNRLVNLAWGTRKENHDDSIRHGTASCLRGGEFFGGKKGWDYVEHKAGEKHHRAKLSDEQVQIILDTVVPGKRDGTAKRLAKEWGVTACAISMVARRIRRRTG